MRFHLGAIPNLFDHALDKHWKSLREPTPWRMQLLALPIGLSQSRRSYFSGGSSRR